MINTRVDTRRLETAVANFATATGKSLAEVSKQQAGILVGHVIALTPPAGKRGSFTDSGGIDLAAKKTGEAKIAADIYKIFPTSKIPHDALLNMIAAGLTLNTKKSKKNKISQVAETIEELRRAHQGARNPNSGRTKKGGNGLTVTRNAVLKQFVKEQVAKVGKLNAGWVDAARKLKTANRNVPAWITRHGQQPGGADLTDKNGKVGIRIYNEQAWFPAGMESRVAKALDRRERGLQKALEAVLERNARRANQST